MKFIGITGGVGAGKSMVMGYLESLEGTIVLLADDLAKELMVPGTKCHEQIVAEFGELSPQEMAAVVFANSLKREKLNSIVHPAVKAEVLSRVKQARQEGGVKYFFFEAALLLEDGYDKLCDELWYIYAPEEVRRARLKETRGYSDERIDKMFASQLPESEFRKKCTHVIDNSKTVVETSAQIDIIMGGV